MTLYQEHDGAGTPLVLLHGWAMNLRVFDALRALLVPYFAITAIDLPGHGRSGWDGTAGAHLARSEPDGGGGPDDDSDESGGLSQQLEQLAAAIPQGAWLLGWSLGGQLALALAASGRCALRGLVLVATTPRFVQAADWPQGLAPATLQSFADALEQDPDGTVSRFLDLQVRGSRHAAEVRNTLSRALQAHGRGRPEALKAGLRLLRELDQREQIGGIDVPALVITGEYDRVTPPAAGQALAALLPQARLQIIPRAGHAPFLSHGAQAADAVRDFVGGEAAAGSNVGTGGRAGGVPA